MKNIRGGRNNTTSSTKPHPRQLNPRNTLTLLLLSPSVRMSTASAPTPTTTSEPQKCMLRHLTQAIPTATKQARYCNPTIVRRIYSRCMSLHHHIPVYVPATEMRSSDRPVGGVFSRGGCPGYGQLVGDGGSRIVMCGDGGLFAYGED